MPCPPQISGHTRVGTLRRWVRLIALAQLGACGSPSAAVVTGQPAVAGAKAKKSKPRAPRWLLLPERLAKSQKYEPTTALGGEGAMGRSSGNRVIAHGMRITDFADGAIECATTLLPEPTQVVELPARFGSGFLHYGRESIWRSETWTGELVPVLRLSGAIKRLIPGFDRLYVKRAGSLHSLLAIDLNEKQLTAIGALPDAPRYANAGFLDAWVGAVQTDLRGLLVSFDAGVSWHPAGSDIHSFTTHGDHFRVRTKSGSFRLERSGRKYALEPRVANADSRVADASSGSRGGERPLAAAVERGIALSDDRAWVELGGDLVEVDTRRGEIRRKRRAAFPEGMSCHGLALQNSPGFLCETAGGPTLLLEARSWLELDTVLRFAGPRRLYAISAGALVFSGGCSGRAEPAESRYCIRHRDGTIEEFEVAGDTGVERLIPLRDGAVVVLAPPRFGSAGSVSVFREGTGQSLALKLASLDDDQRAFAETGLWLRGFHEAVDGSLRGWIVGSDRFAGVKISIQGAVELSEMKAGLSRTILSGPRALKLSAVGVVELSVDGGFHWVPTELPESVADTIILPRGNSTSSHLRLGCSTVGCSFGPWLRIGFSTAKTRPALTAVESPDYQGVEGRPGMDWRLHCQPNGQRSPRQVVAQRGALRAPSRRAALSSRPQLSAVLGADLESSAWVPFFAHRVPIKVEGDTGFDYGTEEQAVRVRGYVWGDPNHWAASANWVLRGFDPYSVGQSLWSSAVTKTPWSDPAYAAQAFGRVSRVRTTWLPVLDASAQAGALMLRKGSSSELHLFEQGRPIVSLKDAVNVRSLAGVLRLPDAWLLAAREHSGFRIFRISGNQVSATWEYPVKSGGRFEMGLARSTRGDSVALWLGGAESLFFYPMDPRTGGLSSPETVSRKAVETAPVACGPQPTGWQFELRIPSSRRVDLGDGSSGGIKEMTARLLTQGGQVCVAEIAGASSQPLGEAPRAASGQAAEKKLGLVPLSLVDRSVGVSWGFACAR